MACGRELERQFGAARAVWMAAGGAHAMEPTTGGAVWGCSVGAHGQLGVGATDRHPVRVWGECGERGIRRRQDHMVSPHTVRKVRLNPGHSYNRLRSGHHIPCDCGRVLSGSRVAEPNWDVSINKSNESSNAPSLCQIITLCSQHCPSCGGDGGGVSQTQYRYSIIYDIRSFKSGEEEERRGRGEGIGRGGGGNFVCKRRGGG